jgi:ATP-dependent protease ClpP protease subunit
MRIDFYKFVAQDEGEIEPTSAELLIFAAIGEWEEMGDVSARAFARDLAKLPASVKRLDIHINSPGGSVFEASGIYSRLADHNSKKIVYIDGLAASAASIVAMVGHKIYIRANANMMIHLPAGIAMGNADEMRKMAAALDTVTESMINVYAKRTGLERAEIRDLMADETWFSPQAAIEKGFADEVRGVVKAAAMVGENCARFGGGVMPAAEFDLSRFHNIPAFSAATKNKPMPKTKVKAQTTEEEDEQKTGGNGEEEKEETKETPTPPVTPEPEKPKQEPAAPAAEFTKGVQAERARVTALQALDRPATHDIVAAAIKDGRTVSDVVAACMAAMDNAQAQNARRADADVLNGIPGSDGGEPGASDFAARLTKQVQARLKQRGFRMQGRN